MSLDWSKIVSGAVDEGGKALDRTSKLEASKAKLKEDKRRRKADALAKAMKRDTGFYRLGTEGDDETAGNRSQAIQDVARGFVESYRRR